MFYRRHDQTDPRFLHLKMILFSVGAVLALAGMITGRDLLIGAAAVVLIVAFLLRLASSDSGEDDAGAG